MLRFCFVEAVLVFARNVATKFEAPTPPDQFFGVSKRCKFYQPSRHDRKRLASNTPDNKNEVTKQNI